VIVVVFLLVIDNLKKHGEEEQTAVRLFGYYVRADVRCRNLSGSQPPPLPVDVLLYVFEDFRLVGVPRRYRLPGSERSRIRNKRMPHGHFWSNWPPTVAQATTMDQSQG
jgi:hypothetical protein